MADLILSESNQPDYVSELKLINKKLSKPTYKDCKRGSLFIAEKALQLNIQKRNIENKFLKIAEIMVDKTLEPAIKKDTQNKNFTIRLNNGISINKTEKSFISGNPYLYKGNDDILIFDNCICNNINILGTEKADRLLIRNSTGLNINTKDGDDFILVNNGYFMDINAGKGTNSIKCDNVSRTNINLEKNSQNSIEVVNNYPNSNNIIKFPTSELKKIIKLNNETENLNLKVEE